MSMNKRSFLLGLAAVPLAGCAGSFRVSYDEGVSKSVSDQWRLSGLSVAVPDDLTVSEANTLAPDAHIVWREEPLGDRRKQVGAIVREGLIRPFAELRGATPIHVRAEVIHFHAVTPRAVSVAPAAVHNVRYALQIFNAQTRKPLTEASNISADLDAFVGASAVTAALQGQTQRVRIVDHIARGQRGWLGRGSEQRREFTSLGR